MTTQVPDEKLLPCPFCGGEMQVRFALFPTEGDRDAVIHNVPGGTSCPIEGAFSIDTFDNGVSVSEAWNRRPELERRAVPAGAGDVRKALSWALDEIDALSNKISGFAYPQGMGMIGRRSAANEDGYENAVRARALTRESEPEEPERCIACDEAFKDDDMILHDAGGGLIHSACCGPERESYVNLETGETIADDEALPTPFPYRTMLYTREAAIPSGEAATHRHVKRGTEYVLIGHGKMQTSEWGSTMDDNSMPVDMREVAIYRSVDDGSLWVRPREEFEDGRFAPLDRAMIAARPKENEK